MKKRLKALIRAFSIWAKDDWDGYNAKAVSKETMDIAMKFAECLGDYFDTAEVMANTNNIEGTTQSSVSAEPDGEIEFEWNKDANCFCVTVCSTGKLIYDGFIAGEKISDIDQFNGILPATVAKNVERVFSCKI